MRMYIFERTVESAKRNHQLRSVRIYGQRVPTKWHFATFLLSRPLRVITRVHQANVSGSCTLGRTLQWKFVHWFSYVHTKHTHKNTRYHEISQDITRLDMVHTACTSMFSVSDCSERNVNIHIYTLVKINVSNDIYTCSFTGPREFTVHYYKSL